MVIVQRAKGKLARRKRGFDFRQEGNDYLGHGTFALYSVREVSRPILPGSLRLSLFLAAAATLA